VIDRSRTNAFEFVIGAGERAKQLMRGCTPRTPLREGQSTDKVTTIAQREVREGKVAKVPVAID
jgi:DNA-directed RNA polymerase omega subunit